MVRRVIPKDALMRIPVAILTTATVLTAAPVRAQTYDPNYPVCLQTYGIGGATSNAAIPRWRSAPSRHRALPPSAHQQSIFCEPASASGTTLLAAPPRLLNVLRSLVRRHPLIEIGSRPAGFSFHDAQRTTRYSW
jgi:hypothetical protein